MGLETLATKLIKTQQIHAEQAREEAETPTVPKSRRISTDTTDICAARSQPIQSVLDTNGFCRPAVGPTGQELR